MSGKTLDTNSFLCKKLLKLESVKNDYPDIEKNIDEKINLFGKSLIVFTTGGIGPFAMILTTINRKSV